MIVRVVDREAIRHTGPLRRSERPRIRINVDADGRSFGERVRLARLARNISQTDLSERAGLTPGSIRDIELEQVKGNTQAHTVYALAVALGCDMTDLWVGRQEQVA